MNVKTQDLGVLQEGHRSVEGEAAEARRRRAQAAARRALMVARRAEEARNARAPRPFGGCVHQGAACVHAPRRRLRGRNATPHATRRATDARRSRGRPAAAHAPSARAQA